MKVLLGMSGGVDSSAAAVLLKKDYDLTGITLNLYTGSKVCKEITEKNINDAKAVCKKLEFEHITLDLSEDFKTFVINDFIKSYLNGLTPNPCLNCNKFIKFGRMYEYAKSAGFDKIATGHYARITEKNGKYYLKKAADLSKDQTYVLYGLNEDLLKHLLLPLGDYTKTEARILAEENGLLNAKKGDSQDICFVPDGNYGNFIEENGGLSKEGNFTDINGNILGKHKGLINYTVGQRKGLGIALGKPAFVISKDAKTNLVVLGENKDLFYNTVWVRDINFITEELTDGEKINCKLRYSQNEMPCTYKKTDFGAALLFDSPVRAPSPGQAAVFYKEDICLGGGTIIKGEN